MLVVLIAVGVALVFVVVLFRLMWRVAEPNQALIISGLRAHSPGAVAESLGFKIVTGKGVLVLPGVQAVRRLSLDLREAELAIECVTTQGIPVGVRGVVIFKVGDDYASIANAARRFLDQQKNMEARVHNVFAGHLRSIVGQLTVEDMIRDREKLTQLTRASSGTEMEKLGLIVDSLQIQEIDDPTGYITNLGRPHAAAVAAQARIAAAGSDREATEKEQEAGALKAEAVRNSSIKQSGFQAEVDEASAKSRQAGPLADAAARQQVVVEETRVAQLEADREEQRLQASVRKPADASAYQETTLARAGRDARISAAEAQAREVELAAEADAKRVRTQADAAAARVRLAAAADAEQVQLSSTAKAESLRAIGTAEADAARTTGTAKADAQRAIGLADAAGIAARAEALAVNQDAVIGQQLAEQWPAIVEAAAKPFGDVDQMILLNGATGLSELLTQALSQGAAGLQMARSLLGGTSGAATAAVPASANGRVPATSSNGSGPAAEPNA